jgi:hypothetical protein
MAMARAATSPIRSTALTGSEPARGTGDRLDRGGYCRYLDGTGLSANEQSSGTP